MIVVVYCLAIVLASLAGGCVPLSKRVTHLKLQVYLSLSSGAMLGAAFFHMLPESAELAGRAFGFWMALGVIGLYIIERFLSPHSHDTSDIAPHVHETGAHHADETTNKKIGTHVPAAPQVGGWSAVVGLSIHTLLGGVALGSAVLGEGATRELGMAVFLATVLHKPADALTISMLLRKDGASQRLTLIVQCIFATLIPVGVLLFYFGNVALAAHLDTAFSGCVLAFSAGTFVCIALSDLLPEVQFHSHDRSKLFLAMLAGAALMWITALIEPSHVHEDSHPHEIERIE